MCGIVGFWSGRARPLYESLQTIEVMNRSLVHRGPDDSGVWHDPKSEIFLGHRRLSINDLSFAGHQPMASPSGRWILTFNGELYNHREIRLELNLSNTSLCWNGTSDTETLSKAIDFWGVDNTLEKLVGMFALSIWDQETRSLILVRDRYGEKPIYYGWQNGTFMFASELKALKHHPDFNPAIDRSSLALFFRHNYIPSPHCIYRGMRKLQPGRMIKLGYNDLLSRQDPVQESYYVNSNSYSYLNPINEEHTIEILDSLIRRSVVDQSLSDKPIGVFLSGGIDSSTVASVMASTSNQPIKTFTIGFGDRDYNESHYASRIARFLGADHTELFATPSELSEVLPILPQVYDEPFADSSQLPTYLLCKLAADNVSVSLSGDGGDELFSGYSRYKTAHRMCQVNHILQYLTRAFKLASPHRSLATIAKVLPFAPSVNKKMVKVIRMLSQDSDPFLYRELVSHSFNPSDLLTNFSGEYPTIFNSLQDICNDIPLLDLFSLIDLNSYLPDCLLVKLDRASMANSLEARCPFLDHRIVEFSSSLPLSFKHRHRQSKWILRQVLHRYLPSDLIDRPKMGFGVPIGKLLRGPLRGWADDLLDKRAIEESGFLDASLVSRMWIDHKSGTCDWKYDLWNVLVWESWRREHKF